MFNYMRWLFTQILTFSIGNFLINNLKTLALQVRYSYITLKALTKRKMYFCKRFLLPMSAEGGFCDKCV